MTCYAMIHVSTQKHLTHIWEQRRWQRQRERQKNNRLSLAKQQLCSCTLFCTFLRHHCTTTTWKYLISRFVQNANTRHNKDKRLSFSFPELLWSHLEFNSRKKCQHLTNWTRWNKSDKVWSSATSLFKWRFRSLCRRCCLSFLECRLDRLAEAFSLCEGCLLAGPLLSSPVLFPRPLVKSLQEAKLVSIYNDAYKAEKV